MYSNSFISPNSAQEVIAHESEAVDITSGQSEIVVSSATSESKLTPPSESTLSISTHNRPARNANPIISRTTSFLDDLPTYKNVADSLDSNDVELSGKIMHFIQPSKTVKEDMINDSMETAEILLSSGEAQGAPQGRSIPLSEPQDIVPTATMTPSFATLSSQVGQGRQANPDIQDIITGIVKLLNGNGPSNTAPPMARPLRPLSTRINNRGPPRITDVPALPPDFDVPAPPLPPPPLGQMPPPVATTRMPTPYPFDIPPQNTSPVRPFVNGVPLPEQIVPQSSKRPGFYRPVTIPPWNRPSHRRPGLQRRPPYKPLPPYKPDSTQVSITSDKPTEDILTLDLGSHLESLSGSEEIKSNGTDEEQFNTGSYNEEMPEVTTETVSENSTVVEDRETIEFEKNKEKSSSKMDKHTMKPELLQTPSSEDLLNLTTSEKLTSSASDSVSPTTTYDSTNIEMTESTLNTTISNNYTMELNSTSVISGKVVETPILESSIQEVLQTLKEDLLGTSTLSSTPTEGLPHVSTSAAEKSESSSLSAKDTSSTTS